MCTCMCSYIQDRDKFVVQMLNGIGDYIDLKHYLSQQPGGISDLIRRMSSEEMRLYTILNGHCSALVKVLS